MSGEELWGVGEILDVANEEIVQTKGRLGDSFRK